MNNPVVRERFIEELGYILMYFSDVLNRYCVTATEFSEVYAKKFKENMTRDYKKQYSDFI